MLQCKLLGHLSRRLYLFLAQDTILFLSSSTADSQKISRSFVSSPAGEPGDCHASLNSLQLFHAGKSLFREAWRQCMSARRRTARAQQTRLGSNAAAIRAPCTSCAKGHSSGRSRAHVRRHGVTAVASRGTAEAHLSCGVGCTCNARTSHMQN
jgi:hypothetical protein